METFTRPRAFIRDPGYTQRREQALKDLDFSKIDPPIVNIIKDFRSLPHCFTLQCCCGHFVLNGQEITLEAESLAKYPKDTVVKYRIAYLALCIQNSDAGKRLYRDLSAIEQVGAGYVQFHGADWFWQRHANSYALQTEPERFKAQDTALVDLDEALRLEEIKARMFEEIQKILVREKDRGGLNPSEKPLGGTNAMKDAALKDLRQIPGVGEKIAGLLWGLGFKSVRDLKDQSPERMYERLCEMRGRHVDRCVLYVFKCAVYFAGGGPHEPELLKWWNWKDAASQEKAM